MPNIPANVIIKILTATMVSFLIRPPIKKSTIKARRQAKIKILVSLCFLHSYLIRFPIFLPPLHQFPVQISRASSGTHSFFFYVTFINHTAVFHKDGVVDKGLNLLNQMCRNDHCIFLRSEEHTSELQSRFDLV